MCINTSHQIENHLKLALQLSATSTTHPNTIGCIFNDFSDMNNMRDRKREKKRPLETRKQTFLDKN